MQEIGYIEYESHKTIHKNIIKNMNDFIKEVPNLSIDAFEKKLVEYMDIWLICHIVYEDKKLLCFKNNKRK